MNGGAFGENFPYSNFHDLNMDWIIKIAKDFLDQYSHIQETLDTGLNDLSAKAAELENLLQEWYDTHSEDIANQLAESLATAITAFNQAADQKAQDTIDSIPDNYTTLAWDVSALKKDKVSKPAIDPNGTSGQLLRTNGDGTTTWTDQGTPTDAQAAEAISAWLDEHPEATTTVQDGSLTLQKFSTNATGSLIFTEQDLESFIAQGGTKAIFGGNITLTKSHTIEGITTLIGTGCVINLNGNILELKNIIDADLSGLNFTGTDRETSILKISGSYSSRIKFGFLNGATLYITTGDAVQQNAFESTQVEFVGLRYSDVIIRKGDQGYITSSVFSFGRYYHGNILVDGNYESLEIRNTVLQTLENIIFNNNETDPVTINGCYVELCHIQGFVIYKNCAVHDNYSTGTTPSWAINEYNQWNQSLRRSSEILPMSPNYKLLSLSDTYKVYTTDSADCAEYVLPAPNSFSIIEIMGAELRNILTSYGSATIEFDLMVTSKNGTMTNNLYTTGYEMYFSCQKEINEYFHYSITLANQNITSIQLVRHDNSTNSYGYKIKNITISAGYIANSYPPLNRTHINQMISVDEALQYTKTFDSAYLYEFNKKHLKGTTITITITDDPADRTDLFDFSFGYYDKPYPNNTSGYVYGHFAFTRHSGYAATVSNVEYVANSFYESTVKPSISISNNGGTITLEITKGSSTTFEIDNLQIKTRTSSVISITANAT